MEKKDIKSMDLEELTQELLAMGEKKFRAEVSVPACGRQCGGICLDAV